MRSFIKYPLILFLVITAAALTSCGSKYAGYGVIYIEDSENALAAGNVYPILQESEIRDVYTLEAEGKPAGVDVMRWKVSFHEKESEALKFAEEYRQWTNIFAVTLLNGLSVREEADSSAERVYKLREGQTVKIIGKDPEMANIADHDGYWYIVLTEDGTSGYCFDKNLRIYDAMEVGSESSSVIDLEKLDLFFSRDFRPENFRDMIRDNMIDLIRFRTNRGLFSFPEEKKLLLSTEDHRITFEYTDVSQNSSGRFIFEGANLQVEMRSEDKIAVYYNHNNKEYAEIMLYIENMDELIESELERRKLIFEQFEELGTVSSTAYGRISFGEENTFSWQNYKRLVPAVIPESAAETGKISLGYFPAPALRSEYDGVISFAFDNIPGGGLVNFLFKLSDLGIKFVYVPRNDIKKGVVEQESSSPLVIFMSGAGE